MLVLSDNQVEDLLVRDHGSFKFLQSLLFEVRWEVLEVLRVDLIKVPLHPRYVSHGINLIKNIYIINANYSIVEICRDNLLEMGLLLWIIVRVLRIFSLHIRILTIFRLFRHSLLGIIFRLVLC